jgi:hypothetical protein
MPFYVSKRTMSLLSEFGDKECSLLLINGGTKYRFGFVSKQGRIKHGPTYWTDYFNRKIINRLDRFEEACEHADLWIDVYRRPNIG